jgi:hypothetical protein
LAEGVECRADLDAGDGADGVFQNVANFCFRAAAMLRGAQLGAGTALRAVRLFGIPVFAGMTGHAGMPGMQG